MLRRLARAVLWTDPLILFLTAGMGSISFVASLADGTGRVQHRIARRWARMVLAVSGVRVEVSGLENLTRGAVYVFCPNHLSLIDTPLMFGYLPWEFRTMAKKGLFRIPFLGWHLRRAGHMPVAAENARSSARNVIQAAHKVADGISILIFPEAARQTRGQLGEFKAGAAYVAIKAGAQVVPVGILGTEKIHSIGSVIVRPGRVELRFGRPISTRGLTSRDADQLLSELRGRIGELIGPEAAVTRAI